MGLVPSSGHRPGQAHVQCRLSAACEAWWCSWGSGFALCFILSLEYCCYCSLWPEVSVGGQRGKQHFFKKRKKIVLEYILFKVILFFFVVKDMESLI